MAKYSSLLLLLLTCSLIEYLQAFDDEDDHFQNHHQDHHGGQQNSAQSMPKDKILLRDVKKLTFLRHKRTTSKRTHSIHQLSCVGGTAGCKLFTPDVVECENGGYDTDKGRQDWRCHAEMSDRVQFNHVEVICEGYDYPEDDYILLGSCGLEFTLDYKDPHDYHERSYFKHLDEHEKDMHHKKVKAKTGLDKTTSQGLINTISSLLDAHTILFSILCLSVLCAIMIVRYFSSCNSSSTGSSKRKPLRGYGPLASAVITTKKAC